MLITILTEEECFQVVRIDGNIKFLITIAILLVYLVSWFIETLCLTFGFARVVHVVCCITILYELLTEYNEILFKNPFAFSMLSC